MTSQLRIYTIKKGKLDEFISAWSKGVVPLRSKHSFKIEGAVVGARSAGMSAVLVDRSGRSPSHDCETIKSLSTVLLLVD